MIAWGAFPAIRDEIRDEITSIYGPEVGGSSIVSFNRQDLSGHCAHGPRCDGDRCLGESVRRLCDLIDPGHSDFRPGYRAAILAHPVRKSQSPSPPTQAGGAHCDRMCRSLTGSV